MALHPMYVRGYEAGYRKGVDSGLRGSMAKVVMEHDLIFIYGIMVLCLIEKHHWKRESVEKLIAEIQHQWHHINDKDPDGTKESMAELVERRTGISLMQMVQETVMAGID